MNDEHPGTEDLERYLEAYASARLAPDRRAVGRIRATLIEEARMRALNARLSEGRGRRRVAAILLAASLTIGAGASVVVGSTAGGPLYQVRIWLETAGLSADLETRALERLHQVDSRVLDVERAASAGDENAVAAASAAYRDAVAVAETEAGKDKNRLQRLKAAIGLHLAVLEGLAQRLPDPAMAAIGRAIQASHKAVDRIDATPPDDSKPGSEKSDEPTSSP